MSNQANRFLAAASVLVLSLASFGGVQANSAPAEVQALQAQYEAAPLTYPEPPFAPVSRLLDPGGRRRSSFEKTRRRKSSPANAGACPLRTCERLDMFKEKEF